MRPGDPTDNAAEQAERGPPLRDMIIAHPRRRALGAAVPLVLMLLGMVGGFVLAARGFSLVTFSFVFPLVVIIGYLIIGGFCGARVIARIDALRKSPAGAANGVDEQLAGCLRRSALLVYPSGWPFDRRSLPAAMAELLVSRGQLGRAYRLADDPARLRDAPEPFDVPFEPIPLDPGNPALKDLRSDQRSQSDRFREGLRRGFGLRKRSRLATILIWLWLIFSGLGLLTMLVWAAVDLFYGRMPLVLIGLLPATLLIVIGSLVRLCWPRMWFVVPGAIVVGTSSWRLARWQLHMFPREQSVFVYWVNHGHVGIARRDGRSFSRRMSPDVAEVALRAWLSPLEPPPLEQLSDLT